MLGQKRREIVKAVRDKRLYLVVDGPARRGGLRRFFGDLFALAFLQGGDLCINALFASRSRLQVRSRLRSHLRWLFRRQLVFREIVRVHG